VAIEAVLHWGKVAISVFHEVEHMVGAREGSLQIAQQRVDGAELLELDPGRIAAGDGAFVGAAGGGALEAPQPVGASLPKRSMNSAIERPR
jgi:hypothetical protein